MRFWIRELFGWALTALGLFIFYMAYALLTDPRHMIWEAGVWSTVGVFVFRGGIHLLKVAVAARVCMQAVDQVRGERTAFAAPRPARARTRTVSLRGDRRT
jgi:hypothetical protein